jgi:hypothetical protein
MVRRRDEGLLQVKSLKPFGQLEHPAEADQRQKLLRVDHPLGGPLLNHLYLAMIRYVHAQHFRDRLPDRVVVLPLIAGETHPDLIPGHLPPLGGTEWLAGVDHGPKVYHVKTAVSQMTRYAMQVTGDGGNLQEIGEGVGHADGYVETPSGKLELPHIADEDLHGQPGKHSFLPQVVQHLGGEVESGDRQTPAGKLEGKAATAAGHIQHGADFPRRGATEDSLQEIGLGSRFPSECHIVILGMLVHRVGSQPTTSCPSAILAWSSALAPMLAAMFPVILLLGRGSPARMIIPGIPG